MENKFTRDFFTKKINAHILKYYEKKIASISNADIWIIDDEYQRVKSTIELATLDQLCSACILIDRHNDAIFPASNPLDHMVCKLGTMHIGIEPNGYAHS
jgi:hypothetical protein